jgi:gliding motility-associated lipoprotein GldH
LIKKESQAINHEKNHLNKKDYSMKLEQFSIVLIFLSTLLLLTSCNADLVISENKAISGDWSKNDTLGFEFEIVDTLEAYEFFINVRHSIEYPYRNIYFFIQTEFPNGNRSNDTIECVLADIRGKWHGTGFGDIKENKILIRKNLQFPISGTYHINFVQAMRDDDLKGVVDIGVYIGKSSEK